MVFCKSGLRRRGFAGKEWQQLACPIKGDQVITTGLGGVYPPDLLVGIVQEVVPEASGKSSIAVIKPGADPRTVKHVFIITDY